MKNENVCKEIIVCLVIFVFLIDSFYKKNIINICIALFILTEHTIQNITTLNIGATIPGEMLAWGFALILICYNLSLNNILGIIVGTAMLLIHIFQLFIPTFLDSLKNKIEV
jgi:hypothetical protein